MRFMTPLALVGLLLGFASFDAECACQTAKVTNGWCRKCEVGYVASIEIKSDYLFQCLDAHGHETDPESLRCETCRAAYEAGSFCEEHRVGFVDEMAYFSRLNYELARGEVVDVDDLCPHCKANARRHIRPAEGPASRPSTEGTEPVPASAAKLTGWCDACNVGMVGNVAIRNKDDFRRASFEMERLLAAIETSKRCEHCAAAQLFDSECPNCRIRYQDGQPVKADPEAQQPHSHSHPHPH